MRTFAIATLLSLALAGAAAADTAGLHGVWTASDGSGAARIAPCADRPERLCATVIADTPEPGAPSSVGAVVLSNLAPAGAGRWRGLYHDGEQTLPVTLRARGADRIEMRVCVGVFCASEHYRRTAP